MKALVKQYTKSLLKVFLRNSLFQKIINVSAVFIIQACYESLGKVFLKLDFRYYEKITKNSLFSYLLNPAIKKTNIAAQEINTDPFIDLWISETTPHDIRIRSLFWSMTRYLPHQLPSAKLFDLLSSLHEQFIGTAYSYIFNVFYNYSSPGEADRHAIFIRDALAWILSDISNSSPDLAKNKITIFSQKFSGSMSQTHSQNTRDTMVSLRKLLKIYTDTYYPDLKNFSEEIPRKRILTQKIKVGLIRYAYTGEIHYFAPILSYLDKTRFDVHVIVFDNTGADNFNSLYPDVICHNISKLDLYNQIEFIRSLSLDIVMNSTSLSGSFLNPIASILNYKVAPVHLTACGDVVTSGFSNMDFFIMGQVYKELPLSAELKEELIFLPNLGYYMPKPEIRNFDKDIARHFLKLAKDDVVFVSNSHLLKLIPELLETWFTVLQQVPQSKLVLMPYNSSFTRNLFGAKFRQMLKTEMSKAKLESERIVIAELSGSQAITQALAAGDVYLDSFPYSGPTSSTEALIQGLPLVTLKGDNYRGDLAAGLLRCLGLKDLIAPTIKDYIDLAVKLGNSKQDRDDWRLVITTGIQNASFFDQRSIAKEYESLFVKLSQL